MESAETSCNRGRPREFCVDEALDAALDVFWRRGYDGASLSDLTDAMGISRPSLYAAFGDKQSLFRKAMDRYVEKSKCLMSAAQAESTARGFVDRLLRTMADSSCDRRRPTGCFLVQSGTACSHEAAGFRSELSSHRAALETLLRDRIARGVDVGDLPVDTDVGELAMFYRVVSYGMAVLAADGAKSADLHRVVDVAMRAWPKSPSSRRKRKPRG